MIDVHTHCLLSGHWGCEWDEHWRPVYGKAYPDVTPEEYDRAMKPVRAAFVFGLRATAAGVATPNDFVERFCAETKTETVGFMSLDPTDPDVLEQMADGVSRGLRGIKLYPVLALFDPRDERYDSFYVAARENGLVLLWHMGATPSPAGDLSVSNPLVVDEVARRHPDLVQIIAHLGHPWQRETIVTLRKNRHVFSDVSASWARPFDGFAALVRAQEWGVVDKLLFGSDFPMWTPEEAISGLRSLGAMRPAGMPHIRPETIECLLDSDPRDALGLR
ncbi:amidohydrolase family protein [Micromonospora sp. DR5-3]|uniref:amidohydrolase family protein n=1 Tax=unclassified Micromonospora TaxID=2617518 RepID=UPI0011D9DEE5|nr:MULTISPECIES: amidohydrolase family protein [unclassified Micromonospora]MCW3818915.1 amidohydrolase family protein [Micromonospora sp. DR5-3]TYC20939.1 amidohydrolase family protein [Micromonospora sp. MP36]